MAVTTPIMYNGMYCGNMSEQQIHNHRENLIDQCQFVIFLFGDSKHRNEEHNSIGVWNEYQIAKKNRKIIILISNIYREQDNFCYFTDYVNKFWKD